VSDSSYYRGLGWFKPLDYPEILWSSSLAQTGATSSPALHRAICAIDAWLSDGMSHELPEHLSAVAELLVEQKFLSKSPLGIPIYTDYLASMPSQMTAVFEKQSETSSGPPPELRGIRVWNALHFESFCNISQDSLNQDPSKLGLSDTFVKSQTLHGTYPAPSGAPQFHLFSNDGQGRAWVYQFRPNQSPCLECVVRRWLSHANLGAHWKALLNAKEPIFWSDEGSQTLSAALLENSSLWRPASQGGAVFTCQRDSGQPWHSPDVDWQPQSILKSPHCKNPQCQDYLAQPSTTPGPFAVLFSANYWAGHGPSELDPGSSQIPDCHSEKPQLICAPMIATATTGDVELLGSPNTPGGRRWRGSGAGWDASQTMKSAVGEAMERYCASQPRELQAGFWQVSDSDWIPKRYLKSQNLDNPDPNLALDLVWGKALTASAAWPKDAPVRRVAAQQVFLAPFIGAQIDPGLSHGLACGTTLEDCLVGGIWELVERDAVAQFWGRLLQQRRDSFLAIQHNLLIEGATLHLFSLPCLLGRTIVALAEVEGKPVFGSAAGVGQRPVLKAISECLHNRAYLERALPSDPGPSPTSFDGHLSYYWHHPDQFPWHLLKQSPTELSLESVVAQNAQGLDMLSELEQQRIQVAYVDLTTSDVRQMGYQVARVLAPQLLSIPERHDSWPLGLARWSSQVGSKKAPKLPHPFG
jgi:ribosomal protein S12 methylthiotransferase accessory factor